MEEDNKCLNEDDVYKKLLDKIQYEVGKTLVCVAVVTTFLVLLRSII